MQQIPFLIYSSYNPYQFNNDILTYISNNLFRGGIITDRFGYLNRYSIWNVDKKVKKLPNETNKSFEEIINSEIDDLISKGNFTLMYSGGVDSTCILSLLLERNYIDFDIMYSENSLKEYPYMFEILKKYPIKKIFVDADNVKNVANSIMKDKLLVTGSHGDKLYYTNLKEIIDKNYNWKKIYKVIPTEKEIYDILEESFKIYDIEVKTFEDLLFWLAFSTTWNYGQPFVTLESLPNGKNHYAFFSQNNFQEWALTRFKNKIKNNIYKKEMKDIIFDFTKDKEYYNNKIKEYSWKSLKKNDRCFIIDEQRTYEINDLKYIEKYQLF